MNNDRTGQGPQLITYADRFGGSIDDLGRWLDGPLADAFSGVHILPFFHPIDGADAGFDPIDHTAVDSRLGDWDAVARVADHRAVMADLIANHMSSESREFRDFLEHGERSEFASMFLTYSSMWPEGAKESELASIYRPRPGLPFTLYVVNGVTRLVWTTFSAKQVDLDIDSPAAWSYLTNVVDTMSRAGVSLLRLDAVGYVGKEAGTSCFMTDSALAFIRRLREYAADHSIRVLLEIHGHHRVQVAAATHADYVYDFALPPLVLHAIHANDASPLIRWLQIRPNNVINVLDTHDGIGIVDVGASKPGAGDGLLDDADIDRLVESIHQSSGGESRSATGYAAKNLDIYQVNCTYFDALAQDDQKMLLARVLQLFVPGIPQVYYVGLLAGTNDMDLLAATGVGRDINRRYYSNAHITEALDQPVVKIQLALLKLRNHDPAFHGEFTYEHDGPELRLQWTAVSGLTLTLSVDFSSGTAELFREVDGSVEACRSLLDVREVEGFVAQATSHAPKAAG